MACRHGPVPGLARTDRRHPRDGIRWGELERETRDRETRKIPPAPPARARTVGRLGDSVTPGS